MGFRTTLTIVLTVETQMAEPQLSSLRAQPEDAILDVVVGIVAEKVLPQGFQIVNGTPTWATCLPVGAMTIDASPIDWDDEPPMCAEGEHVNDDNPGRPICRTCDDDPAVAALYPKPEGAS